MTLNEDGSQQIHISTRRPINTKGSKYSLPAPKGGKENETSVYCSLTVVCPGKHAWNPRLTEDQPEPQQRLSKRAMRKNNPMGEDYLAGNSPFITKVTIYKLRMINICAAVEN